MKRSVVFTKTNAHPKTKLMGWPYSIFYSTAQNANLYELRGVPTEYWTLRDGKVVEMDRPQKIKRKELLRARGLDEAPTWLGWLIALGVTGAVGSYLYVVLEAARKLG